MLKLSGFPDLIRTESKRNKPHNKKRINHTKQMSTKLKTPEQFFYEHAGWSYDPKTETKEQGRRRGARLLAKVERWASQTGVSYEWDQDGLTNRDFQEITNENPEYYLWRVLARDADGAVIGSLCGVDFGKDGQPWGNPYRRVVEAEISLEQFDKQLAEK